MHFTFGSSYFLLLFLLLPCFIWCKPLTKPYYFSKLSWVVQHPPLFSLEPWIKMLLFSLMVLGLAKPFVYDEAHNHHRKGRDLILALDTSGSMAQSGFNPNDRFQTKFQSNIVLAKAFIKKRFDDNMGIVLFGTFAYTASPLTYDLPTLSYLLELSTVGVAGESTAIGDAIMQSLRTLSYGEAKKQAIILLSDGYHNAGESSPKSAVAIAKKRGIKIYTIGIGKPSEYDASLLHTIAKETGGASYGASSSEDLEKVYADIQTLEPSNIRSESYLNQTLLMAPLLVLAWLVLLLWVLYDERRDP